jgi:hypothetical protein
MTDAPNHVTIPGADLAERVRTYFLLDADAALAALKEPTEAMVQAGTRAYDDGEGEYSIYRAMIRAAEE